MTRRAVQLVAAALVLHLVLILPPAPVPLRQLALAPPFELAAVLAMLILGRAWARWLLLPVLSLLAVLKIADLVMIHVSGRGFDPWTDLPLIDAAMRLIAGSFGTPAAIALGIAAVIVVLAIVAALAWACAVWARVRVRPALIACGFVVLAGGLFGDWANLAYLQHRAELARESRIGLQALRQAAAQDPFRDKPGLLAGMGRDVLVIFVESYGRSSFLTPLYAERHVATLQQAERALASAGLGLRSGFLRSPIQGGQSWLAHASFANGLRIGDQGSYGALLSSGRQSLFHFARQAGFQTVAVMPGITRPWPEARLMGFDQVLDAEALGYRGRPFYWVTMPDQFTLVAADRLLAAQGDRQRRFVQIALISSHAPWVPLARILPWDEIGDGTEFDAMTLGSDPPEVVWRDRARVRDSYRDALDYALRVVFGYALRHAPDPPLIFVLGDHQAAPGIALDGGQDVPIHLIGPPELVERSRDWGFSQGLVPDAATPALPMEAMRDLILGSFEAVSASCAALERAAPKNC